MTDPTTPIVGTSALLNLGCGRDTHPAFVNVDVVSAPGVITYDLRHGLPFPDASFELVYHSTMLSCLRPAEALRLTRECRRVLKPGGILRVSTENLEQMCRLYLEKLEAADRGDRQSAYDYEWMLLEIYDQANREQHGGEMVSYLAQMPLPNEEFVYARTGDQGRRIVAAVRAGLESARRASPTRSEPLLTRLRATVRRVVLSALIGSDGMKALEMGRFRMSSGQVTYRMYDRYSLRQLMLEAGFSSVVPRSPRESGYPAWKTVNLDLSSSGDVSRPHTFILEAVR